MAEDPQAANPPETYDLWLYKGHVAFFFEFRNEAIQYLEARAVQKGKTDSSTDTWGWFNVLYLIAEGDLTKLEQILNKPIYEVFTWYAYKTQLKWNMITVIS